MQLRDLKAVENGFITAAKSYSEPKGTTSAASREVGVPAGTLKAAGITRSG